MGGGAGLKGGLSGGEANLVGVSGDRVALAHHNSAAEYRPAAQSSQCTFIQSKSVIFVPVVMRVAESDPVNDTVGLPAGS